MPCFARFPHECTQWRGCEPAHADWQIFGRGTGYKTPDWAFASMCHEAHQAISAKLNPEFSREQRQTEWLIAFVATQNHLYENEKLIVA